MPRSVARGMTMIELLVALGIFAVAVGSILTIFSAGARHGARAREKMEAGRVALAVFDLVDKGEVIGGNTYVRDVSTGAIPDTPAGSPVSSEQIFDNSSITVGSSLWAPSYVTSSPVLLVWKYEIKPYAVDGVAMHQLTVTVSVDEDRDFLFDDTSSAEPDRVVRVYEALLADRRVTP